MARVRGFEAGTQNVKVHPTEVDCFAQVITGADGERYLHLSTFGSKDRKQAPRSSQSLQLDEANARELVTLIRQTFPSVS